MHTAVLEAITKDAVAYTADKGVVGILDQWDKELLMFAIAQMKMVQTWDAAERLRLFDLVRFCRHKLFEENLITPEEFSDILAEGSVSAPDGGSVRRLESYDQMRQCITALEAERDALKKLYRCFHCGFETADEAEAEAHFGDRDDAEEFKPLCRWWIARLNWVELRSPPSRTTG